MSDSFDPSAEGLYFVPLGGAGEIGMNLNLYAVDGEWLIVDLGITFADERLPGVDIVLPDPSFIVEHRERLRGIVLTHAHEDHLGAVPYLWPRLGCPVFATPFAAQVLRAKLAGEEMGEDVPINEVPLGGGLELGPFRLRFLGVTHSIPESNALVIDTPHGRVLHTGDWKIDPEPLVGGEIEKAELRRRGDEGILALVCDSTNVFRDGVSGSEAAVRASLEQLLGECAGRVFVTLFASNIARVSSILAVARSQGRAVVLLGRALGRYIDAARATGYMDADDRFITEEEAGDRAGGDLVYLCTGCQGEPNAALARIAGGGYRNLTIGRGDVVIFSSKIIPGNERAIDRLHNRLAVLGAKVITERDHFVHVSGHPAREELKQMYGWTRPTIAVPVHGEERHLLVHARLAESLGVPEVIVVRNGEVVRLESGRAEIVGHVATGRLALDGKVLVDTEGTAIRERRRLMYDGIVLVTLVLDRHGKLLTEPRLSAPGLANGEDGGEIVDQTIAAIIDAIGDLSKTERRDDAAVHEAVRLAVRRAFRAGRGKRPLIEIQVVRT